MTSSILVSVLMPVYNGSTYLAEAINSVLNQTHNELELIVINDGSTDNSYQIIEAIKDSRIKVVSRPNKGLISTLNEGLLLAKGKYIARHDQDDISIPERLEKQLQFLELNPDYCLIGSTAKIINNSGQITGYFNSPQTHEQICAYMLIDNPFIHGSIMLRNDTIKKNGLKYNLDYIHAEDYYFWFDVLRFGKGFNIQDPLYFYRSHQQNITSVYRQKQLITANKIRNNIMTYYLSDNNPNISFNCFINKYNKKSRGDNKNYSQNSYKLACKFLGQNMFTQAKYEFFVANKLNFLNPIKWIYFWSKYLSASLAPAKDGLHGCL